LRLDSGDEWARASLGVMLIEHGSADEGVALCREAAARHEPSALQCLAFAYTVGRGVPKDPAEVVRWLERSPLQARTRDDRSRQPLLARRRRSPGQGQGGRALA
jgi:hypothetical protein